MNQKSELAETELVITAPIQVKRSLSPGNVYDLLVADFYAKSRRLQGVMVYRPLLWNVNGLPVTRMMESEGLKISEGTREKFVSECIERGLSEAKRYGICFDVQIRDDKSASEVTSFIEANCLDSIREGLLQIATCPSCDLEFGTDPSIRSCRVCGGEIRLIPQNVLYQEASKKDLLDKQACIRIYPEGARKELTDFIRSLPDFYNICITKKREYTIAYGQYALDPRFVVMLAPALMQGSYDRRIYIHGDIIKKFAYYSLCHLPRSFLPTEIVSHGVILGTNGQKIRWQDQDHDLAKDFGSLAPELVRAMFLKRNVAKDIQIDFNKIQQNLREQELLRARIDRILMSRDGEQRTCDLKELKRRLFAAINQFLYGVAYDTMLLIVDTLEKNVIAGLIHDDERSFLNEIRYLYFGEYYGTQN